MTGTTIIYLCIIAFAIGLVLRDTLFTCKTKFSILPPAPSRSCPGKFAEDADVFTKALYGFMEKGKNYE